MGTNFYWHDSPCEHCGRVDIYHVGKRSGGWSFLFHAYPSQLVDDANPEWGHVRESPFGFPVTSRADWVRVFTERRGQLVDEYGEVEAALSWLKALPPPSREQIDKEVGWLRESSTSWREPDPRDAEGFRFCVGDFW